MDQGSRDARVDTAADGPHDILAIKLVHDNVLGLGFRVWGLGHDNVLGLGFRVWGLGPKVWGWSAKGSGALGIMSWVARK